MFKGWYSLIYVLFYLLYEVELCIIIDKIKMFYSSINVIFGINEKLCDNKW